MRVDMTEDDDGNLRNPTKDELRRFNQEVHLSQPDKERGAARDLFEEFVLAFGGAKILREILKYFINCGWTTAEIKREFGASEEGRALGPSRHRNAWGSDGFKKWRKVAWDDLRRHSRLVQTCNCRGIWSQQFHSYTYFRPEATYSNAKYINPILLLLSLPSNQEIARARSYIYAPKL